MLYNYYMKLKPFTARKYRRRIFSQLWMLALQFVLGMMLNLTDADSPGGWHTFYVTVLVLHILNAIGLVEGGIYILLKQPSRLGIWATVVLSLTLICGILTASTENDIWSFLMALGFIVSAWLHVLLYVEADRSVTSGKQPEI